MRSDGRRSVLHLALAFALAAAPVWAGGTMKQVVAKAPVPEDTKPVELSGLVYQTSAWRGEVESIWLEEVPEPGATKAEFVVKASNTRGSFMRIDVEIDLLDASEERVGGGSKTLLLGANSSGVENKIKVKIDTGSWERAEELKVLVRFKSN